MATRRLNEWMNESSTPRFSRIRGREEGAEPTAGADATVGTQVANRPLNVASPNLVLMDFHPSQINRGSYFSS